MIILDCLLPSRSKNNDVLFNLVDESTYIRALLAEEATYKATYSLWKKYAEILGVSLNLIKQTTTKKNVGLIGYTNELGEQLEPAVTKEERLILEVDNNLIIKTLEWYPSFKRENLKNYTDSLSIKTKKEAYWVPVIIPIYTHRVLFDSRLLWLKQLRYPNIKSEELLIDYASGISANSNLLLPLLKK
jgi:hypothetical protein